uniref:Uncharacterized protein n=1 Tax=Anguilla anguilla TaxID=7936 RepID=A0A0E9WQB3_ANGAN
MWRPCKRLPSQVSKLKYQKTMLFFPPAPTNTAGYRGVKEFMITPSGSSTAGSQ